MATQRVRIPCPSCTHRLHIRVEDLGRKGECKYCGHQFRPKMKLAASPVAVAGTPGPEYQAAKLGQRVEKLGRELEKNWALLTAEQAKVVEQIMEMLGDRCTRYRFAGREHESALSRPNPDRRLGSRLVASGWTNGVEPPDEELAADVVDEDRIEVRFEDAPSPLDHSSAPVREAVAVAIEQRFGGIGGGTDSFQFQGEVPVVAEVATTPSADIAKWVNRLDREGQEARAECDQLRREVIRLDQLLRQCLPEVARSRKTADKLRAVRAERNRLNAERAMLTREAAQLQTRLVETQVTLVEVEAELDDCRDRLATERQQWEQERQQLNAQAEQMRAELDSQHGAESRKLERTSLDENDGGGATLVDVECGPRLLISGG